ncbi:MAG: fatty acid desaturase [Betaproteobacteria bacterium]|nr:fatty acid desaturase [Betaproteobacteria bacterium]MBU6511660.1 fatty acid desaturase [Betaproteobacteria bacterium]MDE1956111.1 fatty acid desaturase [Betaproteobacteria bacterium]MDE2151634.1 fatty acid desaturase [Betaproteobacteria bacterium]MDE2480204.1 fatty acid desaturase [Betaproteobacteria bacterium]
MSDATLDTRLGAALLLAHLLSLLALPLWVRHCPGAGWLLLVPVALTLPLWALMHECMHASAGLRGRGGQRLGRALGVAFGAPYRALRLGHLLHHQYNRTELDASDCWDPRSTTRPRAWAGYYARLLGGLYLLEVLGGLASWLPRRLLARLARRAAGNAAGNAAAPPSLAARMLRSLMQASALRELRIDAGCIAVLWTAAAFAWGPHAWMLLAAWLGRALLVSLHDNLYHYGCPLHGDDAWSLRLPRPWALAMLNFNHHATHHRHPRLGWRELPRQAQLDGRRPDAGWGAMLLRQLRGPLPVQRLARPRST